MARKFATLGFLLVVLSQGLSAASFGAMPLTAVNSIAEMEDLQGARSAVQVLSYHPGLNKGGGLFAWNGEANAAGDNCTIFASSSGGKGRWVRQLSGALDATMCGAYWDDAHDDAAVLGNAFAVAAAQHLTLSLPGGAGRICSTVKASRAVIVRGQGAGTLNDSNPSPTKVDATCMKGGWVFEITTPNGVVNLEAPKYYDMEIAAGKNDNPGGCIRWNRADGGFTDTAASQYYMMHPHAERIYCMLNGSQQTGLECSKCFDGDFSQNNINFGKTGIALEGSDVMCIGCAGPNRLSYSTGSLIRLVAHGTFGNMDRVVGNEILYPNDSKRPYDSFIFDGVRSATIEANHIEGVVSGAQSVIHVAGGFSHTIENNDIDVMADGSRPVPVPHWLIADGPFVNFRAFNNGCGGCILGPALFSNHSANYNDGGVRQIITHGGNAANGDAGFPFNSAPN